MFQLTSLYERNINNYDFEYYDSNWLHRKLLSLCDAGSDTTKAAKKCIDTGLSLKRDNRREYVHQLLKGCLPGVVNTPGGGQCDLPGYPTPY
mmetsp:Transcript_47962/g.100270  ORF Transcript_47962/g.100270 Transcript_47962/m.100270 type:complete len:92 (+) Transcript_47962:44-319(+)